MDGSYEYYHYMQDGINDDGWGCAYRSMQTICSWLRLQHYTAKPDPSHREIQKTLAVMGDKELSFVGSSSWIGAIEISLCLQHMYNVAIDFSLSYSFQVTCSIIHVSSGSELAGKGAELASHFETEGTPVMIGTG